MVIRLSDFPPISLCVCCALPATERRWQDRGLAGTERSKAKQTAHSQTNVYPSWRAEQWMATWGSLGKVNSWLTCRNVNGLTSNVKVTGVKAWRGETVYFNPFHEYNFFSFIYTKKRITLKILFLWRGENVIVYYWLQRNLNSLIVTELNL